MIFCPSCDSAVEPGSTSCDSCGAMPPVGHWPRDPWLGRVIHEYTLTERVGTGSYGMVFAARQRHGELNLGQVALKVLRPSRSDQAPRFLREAELARAVHSPHTLAVHAVGYTSEGLPYLVTPLLRGGSLAARLEVGAIRGESALEIAASAADALCAIHDAGLVHRDLKPSNIFVDHNGFVTLLDFGIARTKQEIAEGQATLAGTPAYMSPEHRAGEPMDGKADVYALGVLLHEMLTGSRPRGPVGPRVDREVGGFLSRCLADLPEERPSAREAANWLRRHLWALEWKSGRVRRRGIPGNASSPPQDTPGLPRRPQSAREASQRRSDAFVHPRAPGSNTAAARITSSRAAPMPATVEMPALAAAAWRPARLAIERSESVERAPHWHYEEERGWIALSSHLRPIYVMTVVGDVSETAYSAYLNAATTLMLGPREPYVFVADTVRLGTFSARHRQLQAKWLETQRPLLERLNWGAAFAVSGAIQRGLLTAIFWMQPQSEDVKLVTSRREGLEWARGRLQELGMVPPSLEADTPYDNALEPPGAPSPRHAAGVPGL